MDNLFIYILMLAIPLIAQGYVSLTYRKFHKIENSKKVTGYEVAREILDKNDLKDMYIVATKGTMSDHYDSSRRTIRLSQDVYNGTSIASIAIAAHECGHAIQDKNGYLFMKIRSFIFPVVKIGTQSAYVILLLGIIFESLNLIWIAILLVSLGLLFQLITLPVEFNASKWAKEELEKDNLVDAESLEGTNRMLKAASYTYVAGVLASGLEILRLISIFTNRD